MLYPRLRIHLGLKVPDDTGIEVAGTRWKLQSFSSPHLRGRLPWREGELLVFDDSFEHSVWNDSEEDRIIFILDVPHPELTAEQERSWVWSLEPAPGA
jgi:aspartate beta-hydroxylase